MGLRFRLVEEDPRGTRRGVPLGRTVEADARATLFLEFDDAGEGGGEPPSPGWRAALAGLELLRDEALAMARERDGLLAEAAAIDAARAEARDAFRARVREFNARFVRLHAQLPERLGVDRATADAILTGEALGRGPDAPYENLAFWARREVERLSAEAAAIRGRAREVKVGVRALLGRPGHGRKALPVENYNTIESGGAENEPVGVLGLTRADLARLRAEIRQAERAKAVIEELRALSAALRGPVAGFARERLLPELRRFAEAFGAAALDVQAYSALVEKLGQAGAPAEAVEAARGLEADVAWAVAAADSARAAGEWLEDPRSASLFAPGGVGERLASLAEAARELPRRLDGAAKRVEAVARGIAAAELPESLLPASASRFRALLAAPSPAALQTIAEFRELVAGSRARGIEAAVAEAAATRPHEELFHPLATAPVARIDLGRAGARRGDDVTVKVLARDHGGERSADYLLRPRPLGLFPSVRGELIFARASQGPGDAQDWKPNVAAVADLHYRFRDAAGLARAWNAVDPAFGIHLASLDQGDDSVEFGLGLNLSIAGGFVTCGAGWNLNVEDDRLYYFVGVDLLSVLRELTGAD
jgi:hypothetical protein